MGVQQLPPVPRFEDGVRLTAWANGAENANDYEFAIASAVYLFEIPVGTQYIEILVRYRGEPHRLEIEDIRRTYWQDAFGFVIPSARQHAVATTTKMQKKHAMVIPLSFDQKIVPNGLRFLQQVELKMDDGWNFML